MDYDRLANVYLRMRAKKAAITRDYEAEKAKIEEQMATIEAVLLGELKRTNSKGVRTDAATVYTEEVMQVSCEDWTAYHAWLVKTRQLEGLEKRVGKKFIETYASENEGELPPGIVARREKVVRIRVGNT